MTGSSAAEIDKLAHQLSVDVDELQLLADVPVAELVELRAMIGEALFQADRHHFVRMAALAKAVPVALAAKITQLALPPLLAARTSELFEPAKAVELVGRLPLGYLADVSARLDPGRSPEVVAAMPADTVAEVGVELARRGDWVVLGAFVSYVSTPALRAAVARLDGAQLLQIGFVLDDASRLGEISDLLTEHQLDELLDAAPGQSLWRELDDLLDQLGPEGAARLAGRYGAASASRRAPFDAAAASGALSGPSYALLTGS